MALPDYEIHLNSKQFSTLWEEDDESVNHLFHEDMDEIDKIIEEECGKPRRSKKRNKASFSG